MGDALSTRCQSCGGIQELEVKEAFNDPNLLDIVITCQSCDRTLNAFQPIDEMDCINEGNKSG